MPLQRRYSVTGQTPPDNPNPAVLKSPKLQALDTSVQAGGCGLCDGTSALSGAAAGEGFDTGVRTSSKRSATQLPSPVTMPNSHELPHKIARLELLDSPGMNLDLQLSAASRSAPELQLDKTWETTLTSSPIECSSEASTVETATSSPTATNTPLPPASTPPTFSTLPPEIRHAIYLHLPDLIHPQPLIYALSTFAHRKQHPLASVSRLIRSEALSVFYAYNTWMIKLEYKIMYDAFLEWMDTLGDTGAGALRIVLVGVRSRRFRKRVDRGDTTTSNWMNNGGGVAFFQGAPTAQLTTTAHWLNNNIPPHPNFPPLPAHVPAPPPPQIPAFEQSYCPPDGDASFRIDLSERFEGGKVEVVRFDGDRDAVEEGRRELQKLVGKVWERRCAGKLGRKDWVELVQGFLGWSGWWL